MRRQNHRAIESYHNQTVSASGVSSTVRDNDPLNVKVKVLAQTSCESGFIKY